MAVHCPYCRHQLSFKKAKPGNYAPACTACGRKFMLSVPEDLGQPMAAFVIPSEADKPAAARGAGRRLSVPGQATDASSASETSGTPAGTDRLTTPAAAPREPSTSAGADVTVDLSQPAPDQSKQPRTTPDDAASAPGAVTINSPPAFGSDMATPVVDTPTNLGLARPDGVPAILGGYHILRELGRGGMGAVYLARQISLNRNVALKVMKPLWAANATFVARFTREAYAAAQLTHNNVVQIYDFGEDKGTTYFSMEFVEGQTLGGLIRVKERLDVEEAVGYVLQAARGLKCAHDQSMVHRDIKPDNLLLNRQGIVKVADLGLVKTPEAAEADEAAVAVKPAAPAPSAPSASSSPHITPAHVAIGTPTYMAPEQALDAANVDPRADIYSLGCTLYVLLTGRTPFEGRSVLEILSKHQTQPIIPPDVMVKRVPKALSAIILKMVAKKPQERYADLGDVIRDLESFLGVSSTGSFTPREEHASLLEQSVKAWNESPAARKRAMVLPAILGACVAMAILCLLPGWRLAAAAFLSLGLFIALADFVIVGLKRKTPLFTKACALILGSSLSEWLTVAAGLILLIGLLFVLKLFWIWVALALAAVGIAMALQVGLDARAETERRAPLEQIEGMLRSLRLQGVEEDALRQFVCKFSGPHWEEVHEALFGYEAKLLARDRWGRGEGAKARRRYAAWRDPIVRWIDARLTARREAKELAVLQKIEERSLESQGVNLVTARRKAERAARAMVATAAEIRETIRHRDGTIMVDRSIALAMREAAVTPEKVLLEHERGQFHDRDRQRSGILAKVATLVVGPKTRFLAGAALLAGCIAWMHQNAMISAEQASAAVDAAKSGDLNALQTHAQASVARVKERVARKTETLDLPVIPPAVLHLVSSLGAGAAGLILIVSSFLGGIRIAFFAIPAAAIPILGPGLGLPSFFGLDRSLIPSIVGAGVLAAGLIFGRAHR
jgi:eukaryotic-like serine/threonine-protein kinase